MFWLTNTDKKFDLEFKYKRHQIFWLGFGVLVLYIKTHSNTHTSIHPAVKQQDCNLLNVYVLHVLFLVDQIQLFHLNEFLFKPKKNKICQKERRRKFHSRRFSFANYWFWHGIDMYFVVDIFQCACKNKVLISIWFFICWSLVVSN